MGEDIVESTPSPSFFTNFTINMVGFVNPHKLVAKRNAISTFSSPQNESELETRVENEELKNVVFHCPHHTPKLFNNYLLQCNHLCNHLMHGHSKNKSHGNLVPMFIHCL